MRRMTRGLMCGVCVLLVVPACSDAFGVDDVLGVWSTQTINGHAVPGTVIYEGIPYDTQYVRWTFYDGGQCTLTQLVDGVTATYDACAYTVTSEQRAIAIVFLDQVWNGIVAGSSMTLTDPQDVAWVLRAQ